MGWKEKDSADSLIKCIQETVMRCERLGHKDTGALPSRSPCLEADAVRPLQASDKLCSKRGVDPKHGTDKPPSYEELKGSCS